MKRVLTYGTFDTLHFGHINLLRRAKQLAEGGPLIVALSTDEFNAIKGKYAYQSFSERRELLEAIRYVDEIIEEYSWDQKAEDIRKHRIDLLVMGDDWADDEHFTCLAPLCELVFLPRTKFISSTQVRNIINTGQ